MTVRISLCIRTIKLEHSRLGKVLVFDMSSQTWIFLPTQPCPQAQHAGAEATLFDMLN